MQYFDVENKAWKPLASLTSARDRLTLWFGLYCAETLARNSLSLDGSQEMANAFIVMTCNSSLGKSVDTHVEKLTTYAL